LNIGEEYFNNVNNIDDDMKCTMKDLNQAYKVQNYSKVYDLLGADSYLWMAFHDGQTTVPID